jgi:hypothetical protein
MLLLKGVIIDQCGICTAIKITDNFKKLVEPEEINTASNHHSWVKNELKTIFGWQLFTVEF